MIIGINGPIGSGKNEVARILEKNFGFTPMGFADKLKESAAALFGIDPELWNELKNSDSAKISLEWKDKHDDGEFLREIVISVREFLKRYGTESHRDVFWSDIWVDALFAHLTPLDDIAIYDARFNNELRKIKQHNGFNIQVKRPGHKFDPTHPSETAPDPKWIDHIIYNDHDLDWLEDLVKDLVQKEKLVSQYQLERSDNLSQSPSPQLAPSS